jgi:hypothetical protein
VGSENAATAAQLAQAIENYLADHPAAALLEDGCVVFDMRTARYSVGESHGRCLLQFWSDERNLMRTVAEVQPRAHSLRLMTRRIGLTRPQMLELVPNSDRRTPTTRDSNRRNYQRMLERVLSRYFVDEKVDGFRSAMDLEHSFGPAYVRGRTFKGTHAVAVVGVSEAESSAIIDGVLTIGLLWLDYCRQHTTARRHFGGLKVIVPAAYWRTTAERMAWLNHAVADFQLFTLNERSEELEAVDFRDTGNLESRLVRSFSRPAAIERCQSGIDRLMNLLPRGAPERIEVLPSSPTHVGLLLHGLEFARVHHGLVSGSFSRENEITFGAGANETPLTEENEALAQELFARLIGSRHPDGSHIDPLFRLQPERWLESRIRSEISDLLPGLRPDLMYSQVPALSSGDRGMLDLLTLDRKGQLVVIELKANEDLHLPLQALDYWIRVRALNADRRSVSAGRRQASAFEREGYFEGAEVSPLEPRLLLIAPALRIHPANESILGFLSPKVEWDLLAVGEHWRRDLRVVFRKSSRDQRRN